MIDERIWPLPNAFNIREGSPFGRSEAYIKARQLAEKNQRNVLKAVANREAKKGKPK
jgi:hypothetical protein